MMIDVRHAALKYQSPDGEVEALRDVSFSMIVGVMVGVLVTWVEHGETESREEVRSVIRDEFETISGLGIMEAVYTLCNVDRGVPEVWASVYDVRDLLYATSKLLDGKKPLEFIMLAASP